MADISRAVSGSASELCCTHAGWAGCVYNAMVSGEIPRIIAKKNALHLNRPATAMPGL